MFPWNAPVWKVSRRKMSRKEPNARLVLEPLESRTLLSVCTVDRLSDNNPAAGGEGGNGTGDLRYCITQAADGDSITFGVTGAINLTGPLPDLTGNLTILGPGADALTVRRSTTGEYREYRIFTVDTGAAVTIAGLTIAGGFLSYRTSSHPKGGGIYVAPGGSLTLAFSILQNNNARGDPSGTVAGGGGLYTDGMATVVDSTIRDNLECCQESDGAGAAVGAEGTLVVDSSTFSGNFSAGNGGGLVAYGSATITNSTFSGNGAAKGGGAIYGYVEVNLTNSTLSGNSAIAGGGGVYGRVRARNTIIAGNSSSFFGPDISSNFGSRGHNLIGNTQGGSGFDTTDLLDVDPILGRLQDNGGPTQTIALLPGSPALNAGDPNELGVPDQRGVTRSGGVNIGAFQASASAFVLSAPAKVRAGVPFDLTLTAVDPFGQAAVGYTGTVTFRTTDPDAGVVLPADYTFTAADAGMHTFTDTGLGETTLRTRGPQTVTATDAADGSITGSANVKVKHPRHHDGNGGGHAGSRGTAIDPFFCALREVDLGSWVLSPDHRHAGS